MPNRIIDIAKDFTRFPAGRYRTDGPFSGERFRDDILVPALSAGGEVAVNLDGTMGFGSSFLEEAFGGAVRGGLAASDLRTRLVLVARDRTLIDEVWEYIDAA